MGASSRNCVRGAEGATGHLPKTAGTSSLNLAGQREKELAVLEEVGRFLLSCHLRMKSGQKACGTFRRLPLLCGWTPGKRWGAVGKWMLGG